MVPFNLESASYSANQPFYEFDILKELDALCAEVWNDFSSDPSDEDCSSANSGTDSSEDPYIFDQSDQLLIAPLFGNIFDALDDFGSIKNDTKPVKTEPETSETDPESEEKKLVNLESMEAFILADSTHHIYTDHDYCIPVSKHKSHVKAYIPKGDNCSSLSSVGCGKHIKLEKNASSVKHSSASKVNLLKRNGTVKTSGHVKHSKTIKHKPVKRVSPVKEDSPAKRDWCSGELFADRYPSRNRRKPVLDFQVPAAQPTSNRGRKKGQNLKNVSDVESKHFVKQTYNHLSKPVKRTHSQYLDQPTKRFKSSYYGVDTALLDTPKSVKGRKSAASGKSDEKRQEHNMMERKRREHLKSLNDGLKVVIPTVWFEIVKKNRTNPSRQTVLDAAREYVKDHRKRYRRLKKIKQSFEKKFNQIDVILRNRFHL